MVFSMCWHWESQTRKRIARQVVGDRIKAKVHQESTVADVIREYRTTKHEPSVHHANALNQAQQF